MLVIGQLSHPITSIRFFPLIVLSPRVASLKRFSPLFPAGLEKENSSDELASGKEIVKGFSGCFASYD